jgi:hypothetical protein
VVTMDALENRRGNQLFVDSFGHLEVVGVQRGVERMDARSQWGGVDSRQSDDDRR